MRNKLSEVSLAVIAILGAVVVPNNASAIGYDLTAPGDQSVQVDGDVGGIAIFSDNFVQPTGTGVFEPFLTLDSNGQTSTGQRGNGTAIEQGYNTDGFTALYLDQLRPQWNERLTLGDLAQIDVNGALYYAFLLDSNEPGAKKSTISIDNIRIYTSATDNTANVADDISKLDSLGTLRWAMNDDLTTGGNPDLNGFNVDQWVKLDSSQENVGAGSNNSNGGSGMSDMVLYVPVTDFAGSLPTDYLWFYNLNGVHFSADSNLAAESGYEEWRAVTGPQRVPEGGFTIALLGAGMIGIGALRRRLSK